MYRRIAIVAALSASALAMTTGVAFAQETDSQECSAFLPVCVQKVAEVGVDPSFTFDLFG